MQGKDRKLRRNDVVFERGVDWIMYGRVWRRIDSEHVQVIDCGLYIRIYKDIDLELTDYKGKWAWQRHPGNSDGKMPLWVRMTSLRELKKQARMYHAHFGGHRFPSGKRWSKAQRKTALEDRAVYQPNGTRSGGTVVSQ